MIVDSEVGEKTESVVTRLKRELIFNMRSLLSPGKVLSEQFEAHFHELNRQHCSSRLKADKALPINLTFSKITEDSAANSLGDIISFERTLGEVIYHKSDGQEFIWKRNPETLVNFQILLMERLPGDLGQIQDAGEISDIEEEIRFGVLTLGSVGAFFSEGTKNLWLVSSVREL